MPKQRFSLTSVILALLAIVTVAMPILVTALDLIPMYQAHRRLFSMYTSFFCFLVLVYVFYSRYPLSRLFIRRRALAQLLPLIGIASAIACFVSYQSVLSRSVVAVREIFTSDAWYIIRGGEIPTSEQILQNRPIDLIPFNLLLIGLYVGAFVSAAFAVAIMATREYMRDTPPTVDQAVNPSESSPQPPV